VRGGGGRLVGQGVGGGRGAGVLVYGTMYYRRAAVRW
jgi:hypothetical protein